MSDESSNLPQEEQDLIRQIETGTGGGIRREAALARLQALHASGLSRDLKNLADGLHNAKQTLGERISEMNAQMELTRQELQVNSDSANAHSRALVLWTKRSVWAIVAYVFLTAGLLGASAYQIQVAISTLQAQVEPELIMEVVRTMQEGTRLILTNDGTYSLIDLSIDTDLIGFVGSPFSQKVSHVRRIFETAGSPWWKIDKLEAGETQTKSLEELGQEALAHIPFTKSSMESGHLPGIAPGASALIMSTIKFTMVAHRPVDRRRHRQELFQFVFEEAKSGKPRFVDPRQLPNPYLQEAGIDR